MYKFQLPATGPLATPLLHRYIRKQVISIRHHYKEVYLRCNNITNDGVLCFAAVYNLLKRSAGDMRMFVVLSYILTSTDTGKHSTPLEHLYEYFSGVIREGTLDKIIRQLNRLNFIKLYQYNPDNPTGKKKHITLAGGGKIFYESFTKALEHHFLYEVEDPEMPRVNLKTVKDAKKLNYTHKLQK